MQQPKEEDINYLQENDRKIESEEAYQNDSVSHSEKSKYKR